MHVQLETTFPNCTDQPVCTCFPHRGMELFVEQRTMYARVTDDTSTFVTLGDDDRGLIRTVRGERVSERPLLFPANLSFADADTRHIPDRDKLDSVLSQRGYSRFDL